MSRFESFTTSALLELYRDTLRELRDREVIRTANAPAGDYAKYIVRCAFPGSELRNRGQRQLSPFRSFGFDAAASYCSTRITVCGVVHLVPRETVENHTLHRSHVNGAVLFATDPLLGDPDATDITDLLREASAGDARSLESALHFEPRRMESPGFPAQFRVEESSRVGVRCAEDVD